MIKLKRLIEDASPQKFDKKRMPKKLSQQDPDTAAAQVVGGGKDGDDKDDIIKVNSVPMMVKDLKPSQTSMEIDKAMSFAIKAIIKDPSVFPGTDVMSGKGGDLGAFVSDDDHILDGHHRWIGFGMVNPDTKFTVNKVAWPVDPILNVFNAITVGKGFAGPGDGKKASGGFEQFSGGSIEGKVKEVMAKGDSFGDKPDVVKGAFKTMLGKSAEDQIDDETLATEAAEFITANVASLNFKLPPGAPSRPDMPIISAKAGHVKAAIAALEAGEVDVNPPYADVAVEDGYKPTRPLIESFWNRFQKIANIKR